jgi:hypothetical protein
MNPTSVRRLRELKIKQGQKGIDPPAVPKIDSKNWPKNVDELQDHFSCIIGKTKAPLAYVTRDTDVVPPEDEDPTTDYLTPEDEMIRRMPHKDAAGAELPTSQHDKAKVWQILSEVCREEKCWIYIKPCRELKTDEGPCWPLLVTT